MGIATVVFFLGHKPGKSERAIPASTQEYDRVLVNGKPTLIDFYADWCVACQMNAPALEALSRNYAGQVNFLQIDVDRPENASFVRRYHVNAIPRYTFLAVGGREVSARVGWQADGELRAAVDALDQGYASAAKRSGYASSGLYGYVDRFGQMVIAPRFTLAGEFFGGEAYVRSGDKEALIDRTGRLKRYLSAKEQAPFEDLLPFEARGKWGFHNRDGKFAIPARYDEVTDFADNRAGVKLGRRWGFIDRTGALAIPVQFDEAQRFWVGRAAVRIGEHWGMIDTQGKVVIPVQFEQVGRFRKSEPLVPVRERGLWGFLDAKGHWVVRPRFDGAKTTMQGMSPVRQGSLWGFIDNRGRLVVPPRYEQVAAFSKEYAWVYRAGKYAFIDRSGKQITALVFDRARPFSDSGLAAVEVGGRWGYIDGSGRFVLSPRFADASPFSEGLAAVKLATAEALEP